MVQINVAVVVVGLQDQFLLWCYLEIRINLTVQNTKVTYVLHVIVAVLHLQYHFVEKHDSLYPAFFVKSRLVTREIRLRARNALQTGKVKR